MRPSAVRREIPDRYLGGLYLIVQPTGAKSWAIRYRHNGQTRKYTLGSYPAYDLKSAREAGAKALRRVAEGYDPGVEREQVRAATRSFDAIVEEFLSHSRRNNRPRTVIETQRLLQFNVLPKWHTRSIDSITKRDVLDALDAVVERGAPVQANRLLEVIRRFFNWCIARDIIATSPCQGVKPPTVEVPRDRVLSDDELRLVWHAAGKVSGPFAHLVKLLILTGARRDEVGRMRWDELNLESALWVLPRERVKNNRQHEVPLSAQALAVIESVPRIDGSPFVLTTNGRQAATGYAKNVVALRALLPPDMLSWTLHDLRRTAASGMARLGIALPAIERVLNHTSGSFAGIVGVYQRHNFADEKRAALVAWGNFVEGLLRV
jgi:integrase